MSFQLIIKVEHRVRLPNEQIKGLGNTLSR